MFRRVSSLITGKSHKKAKAPKVLTERNLIEMESKLGQTILVQYPKARGVNSFASTKILGSGMKSGQMKTNSGGLA